MGDPSPSIIRILEHASANRHITIASPDTQAQRHLPLARAGQGLGTAVRWALRPDIWRVRQEPQP